jgi:predicted ArsR family transcriptional regulator
MGWEAAESDTWSVPISVEETVLAALPKDRFVKFDELADRLGLIPWEVLQACQQLIKRGVVVANLRPRSGEFRRRD